MKMEFKIGRVAGLPSDLLVTTHTHAATIFEVSP